MTYCHFALWGSVLVKAVHKHVGEINPKTEAVLSELSTGRVDRLWSTKTLKSLKTIG